MGRFLTNLSGLFEVALDSVLILTGSGTIATGTDGALNLIEKDGLVGVGLIILSFAGKNRSFPDVLGDERSARCFASNNSTSRLVGGIEVSSVAASLAGLGCKANLLCCIESLRKPSCAVVVRDREAALVAAI